MRLKYKHPTFEDNVKISEFNPWFWIKCEKCRDKIKKRVNVEYRFFRA